MIQEGHARDWRLVADTALRSPGDYVEPGDRKPLKALQYKVEARSIAVFCRAN
jgi:hypothetical protein